MMTFVLDYANVMEYETLIEILEGDLWDTQFAIQSPDWMVDKAHCQKELERILLAIADIKNKLRLAYDDSRIDSGDHFG